MSHLRRWIAPLALAGVLVGCGSTPPVATIETAVPTTAAAEATAPAATIAPTNAPAAEPTTEPTLEPTTVAEPETTETAGGTESEDAIRASMQETVDNYDAAYNENNLSKLQAAIDPKNSTFKRSLEERFKSAMESQFAGMYNLNDKVGAIRDRGNGYWEATIETNFSLATGRAGRAVKKWVFKDVDGKWLMTEPRRAELGKKLKYETEHFTIDHYAWDDEVMPEIGQIMETAYATALKKLGKVPEGKMIASVTPTYETAPGISSAGWVGAYYPGSGKATNPDRMVIRSPLSFGFVVAVDEAEGFVPELQGTMTHEFTHLVVNRAFVSNARMSWWMSEGIAEHVSDNPRPGELITALQNGNIIPLVDTSDAIYKQDLQHGGLLESNITLAYGEAYEMVDFIYKEKGGYDGWWKFVGVYDKTQSIEETIKSEFNMTVEEFEAKYHDFLKQKYG